MKFGDIYPEGDFKYDGFVKIYEANIVATSSNSDIIDENFSGISDWTDSDTGSGVSSSVIFDGKNCLKLDTGGTTDSNANIIRDVGTFGSRTVCSISTYLYTIGASGGSNDFQLHFYNGSTGCILYFTSSGLFTWDGASYVEFGTNVVVSGIWQEWTFDINWTSETVTAYLNNDLIQAGVDCSYADATANGTVRIQQQSNTSTINQVSYVDFIKIGTDFSSVGTNEIAGVQTSITVSGLHGDIDKEYLLSTKLVNGYNGATTLYLRPNNDTGTNYGYQRLYNSDATTAAALRDNADTHVCLNYADAIDKLGVANASIYAKSGYARTILTQSAEAITGTTVTAVNLFGHSWNNTVDEITSLVLYADQTNGIGTGSQITLYKKEFHT